MHLVRGFVAYHAEIIVCRSETLSILAIQGVKTDAHTRIFLHLGRKSLPTVVDILDTW